MIKCSCRDRTGTLAKQNKKQEVTKVQTLVLFMAWNYLTIRLWAQDFYRVIVDGGEARINYRATEIESE